LTEPYVLWQARREIEIDTYQCPTSGTARTPLPPGASERAPARPGSQPHLPRRGRSPAERTSWAHERLDGDQVVWSHHWRERVDAIILATGYRPSLGYLRDLGALDPGGAPLHAGGISVTHLGLVYLGLEYQRSFASNTLRGVSADACAVIAPLVAWIGDAPRGLTAPQTYAVTSVGPGWAAHSRGSTNVHIQEATASAATCC
jgi:hypothetical protein